MSEHDESCVGQALRLPDLATNLMGEAREHHSQRAANTILSGSSMRATVIALVGGAELAEHEAPPAATLQVVSGEVELIAGEERWPLGAGDVIAIPARRHSATLATTLSVFPTSVVRTAAMNSTG